MELEPAVVCDLFYPDRPRLALDDVLSVEIEVKVGGDQVWTFGTLEEKVLCAQARKRLIDGLERLTKPPAKRKKDSADA